MYLSEARPSVEAELRDMVAEERSDVSVRSLNETWPQDKVES